MVLCPKGIHLPILYYWTFLLADTSVQRYPMLYPGQRLTARLLQEENAASLENLGEILSGTAGVEHKALCWFTVTQHILDLSVQNWMTSVG